MKNSTKNHIFTMIRLIINTLDAFLLCKLLYEHQKRIEGLLEDVRGIKDDLHSTQSDETVLKQLITPDFSHTVRLPIPVMLDVQDPVESNAAHLHKLLKWCESVPEGSLQNGVQVFFVDRYRDDRQVAVTNIARNGEALDVQTTITADCPEKGNCIRNAGINPDRMTEKTREIAQAVHDVYESYIMESDEAKYGLKGKEIAQLLNVREPIEENAECLRTMFRAILSVKGNPDKTKTRVCFVDRKDNDKLISTLVISRHGNKLTLELAPNVGKSKGIFAKQEDVASDTFDAVSCSIARFAWECAMFQKGDNPCEQKNPALAYGRAVYADRDHNKIVEPIEQLFRYMFSDYYLENVLSDHEEIDVVDKDGKPIVTVHAEMKPRQNRHDHDTLRVFVIDRTKDTKDKKPKKIQVCTTVKPDRVYICAQNAAGAAYDIYISHIS